MPDEIPLNLVYEHGLWLGTIPSPYGPIELVISGTKSEPDQQQLAALRKFLPQAGDIIHELSRKLPLSFLWRPVRLVPNNQNRIGIQFQQRFFGRRSMMFADEVEK